MYKGNSTIIVNLTVLPSILSRLFHSEIAKVIGVI